MNVGVPAARGQVGSLQVFGVQTECTRHHRACTVDAIFQGARQGGAGCCVHRGRLVHRRRQIRVLCGHLHGGKGRRRDTELSRRRLVGSLIPARQLRLVINEGELGEDDALASVQVPNQSKANDYRDSRFITRRVLGAKGIEITRERVSERCVISAYLREGGSGGRLRTKGSRHG